MKNVAPPWRSILSRTWNVTSRRHAPWLWPTTPTTTQTAALTWIVLLYLGFWGPSLVRIVHWWTSHSLTMTGTWRTVALATQCAGDLLLIIVTRTALFTRHRGRRTWWAWATLAFFLTLARALFIPASDSAWHYLAASVTTLTEAGLLVLASIVLVAPLAPRAVRPRRNTWLSLEVFVFALVAFSIGTILAGLFQWLPGTTRDYPMPAHPTIRYMVAQQVSDAMAGPAEEVFFCLLLVTLLRQAGSRWTTITCWCIGLRLLFHLYYGPPAVFLMAWALLTLALYRTTGRWIAIAVMHSLNDMLAQLSLHGLLTCVWMLILLALIFRRWGNPRLWPFWAGPIPRPQPSTKAQPRDGAAGLGGK